MVDVELKSFDNDIAELNCYPEGHKEEEFSMIVDLQDKKIINCSIETTCNSYVYHAARKMYEEFDKNGTLPDRTTAMWY